MSHALGIHRATRTIYFDFIGGALDGDLAKVVAIPAVAADGSAACKRGHPPYSGLLAIERFQSHM